MTQNAIPDAAPPEGATRRTFIQGIAAAGASTAAVAALDRAGLLEVATAHAADPGPFADFTAIAPSPADAFEVPPGYRADVLIGWGDTFANEDGTVYEYGFNNDFLAYFPIKGSDEGLLFVNHEYPSPYFQHGQTDPTAKTVEQIELEQDAVGNSILHVRRNASGLFQIISPSPYNRRITGAGTPLTFTGPLAENPAYPGIGVEAAGSVANCSGGITPWGTALSCEENYQDYALTTGFGYGWSAAKLGTTEYVNGDGSTTALPAKYGWVCEHDPYDPSFVGRKHTALGRFRHENTAFRAEAGKKFVLYMGDDIANGGVYKFVSDYEYRPGRRSENLKILTKGKLYIARWEPGGRRSFDVQGNLTSAEEGTGTWREVAESELVDTQAKIMAAEPDFLTYFATNRPEDLEVGEDGTVWIALTNNSTVRDSHGSIRTLREAGNDATSVGSFTWQDYAPGGQNETGFSCPDNLVFDKAGNTWVVTDISSGSLNGNNAYQFHANNAVFMVPPGQPEGEVKAFRFANMPVHSEGTGPYFTPDEKTLFVNVQHPGENSAGDPADPANWTSYWPKASKAAGVTDGPKPIPSTVQITKIPKGDPPVPPVIPPPVTPTTPDTTKPDVDHVSSQIRKLSGLRRGAKFTFEVDEPGTLTLTLSARLRKTGRKAKGRGKLRQLARKRVTVTKAGDVSVTLRPSSALRVLLKRERELPATLKVEAVDVAGNRTTKTVRVLFR